MADWLNIAGGAGKGYVEGQQDLQRTAEFNALQQQRQRVVKQQQMDDELQRTLQKIRPPGSYTDTDSSPEAGAEGPPSPTVQASRPTTTSTVTDADYARQQANAFARSGRPDDIARSATLRAAATQYEQAARATRQANAQEVLSNAGQQIAAGDHVGAIRTMQQGLANAQHPDGHQVTLEDRGGVPYVGVAGPDGRYTQQPQPATPEAAKAMLNQGYAMLNSDTHFKAQELGIHQQTADATTMQAQAAQQHATTEASKVYWDTIGDGGSAELAKKKSEEAYNYAHANYMNNRTSLDRLSAKFGQTQQFFNTNTGQTELYTPTRARDGTTSWQKEILPQGVEPFKQPQVWDQEQQFYAKALETHEQNNTGPYKLTKDGKVDQSAVDKYKVEHRLNSPPRGRTVAPGGGDPYAAAVNQAGPPKPDDKAAPAAPAPRAELATRAPRPSSTDVARASVETAQNQLKEQFARGEVPPADFARSWAALEKQKQAVSVPR